MEAMQEDFKMYFYENRIATFSAWPFNGDCSCTSENIAKAGFIHRPTEESPDGTQCFFCYQELEGWKPEEDPFMEHKSHSPACNFILLEHAVEELTVEGILKLQNERQKFYIKKFCKSAIERFEEAAKSIRGEVIKLAMEGEGVVEKKKKLQY